MTDLARLETALRNAHAAGDTAAAAAFAGEIRRIQSVPQREPDPASERFLRGLQQPVVGAAQLMARPLAALGESVERAIPGGGDYLRSLPERMDAIAETLRAQSKTGAPEGIDWATIAGESVATAPAMGLRAVQGAGKLAQLTNRLAQGGTVGAALSPSTEAGLAADVGVAAAASAALPPVARAAAKAISPATRTAAGKLAQKGITLTPGMALGSVAKRAEDALSSVPLLGDVIKSAQRKSFESFNRAAVNDVLEPLGKKLPKDIDGREAIAFADGAIGGAYDDLLPKLRVVADGEFLKNVVSIRAAFAQMPRAEARELNHILQKEVLGRFTPAGRMDGETMKAVESRLGKLASAFALSDKAYAFEITGAVRELQAQLRALVARSNPEHAAKLSAINVAYAKFLRVNDAASRVTSESGVFSPEALLSSVKKLDKSKHKKAFSKGEALMQDFAERARSVMGRRVPDSGTPQRLLTGAGLFGAGHYMEPTITTTAGLAALPYLPGARQVLSALLLKRPPGFSGLASGVERGGTALAPLAGVPAVSFSP